MFESSIGKVWYALSTRITFGHKKLFHENRKVMTPAAARVGFIVGFVGLIAPHLARSLVGSRHSRVVPVAVLLGALLVSVADTLGRTVIAPAQIPAGLLTALIGAPYFIYLLWRTRRSA